MIRTIAKSVNSVLRPLGVQLTRAGAQAAVPPASACDPSTCYMETPALKQMLRDELANTAKKFYSERIPDLAPKNFDFHGEVERFIDLFSKRERKENVGGSGFHNMFWLYLTARMIDPELIVESGVWKGHTSRLLEQAFPKAEIHGFDITLDHLEYHNTRTKYHQQDWSTYDFGRVNPDKSLVFLDCHFNHARRIIEAKQKGFKHLVLDDNTPAYVLYVAGMPPFPTAHMVYTGIGTDMDEVKWRWHGKPMSYKIDKAEVAEARKLMAQHEIYPNVAGPTRFGTLLYLTYVRVA